MLLLVLFCIFFLELYTVFLAAYLGVKILKKKKLPYLVLIIELIWLILAFYCKHLINSHELLFAGRYENGGQDWGAGLSNVSTYLLNMWILIGIFAITQIAFWPIYLARYKRLNETKDKPLDLLLVEKGNK